MLQPSELVSSAVRRFQPLTDDTGIVLTTDVEANLPAISADGNRIQQVLDNLITNALRHTPTGGTITLSAKHTGVGVTIDVHNTGTPLSQKDAAHVFERFWRADDARDHHLVE